ncbi:hypothetical protein HOF56_04320 [Candidatus Peribacteria bacterium]|nr:hypothetical protein [Candidatus Peribacteria bacterium]
MPESISTTEISLDNMSTIFRNTEDCKPGIASINELSTLITTNRTVDLNKAEIHLLSTYTLIRDNLVADEQVDPPEYAPLRRELGTIVNSIISFPETNGIAYDVMKRYALLIILELFNNDTKLQDMKARESIDANEADNSGIQAISKVAQVGITERSSID